MNMDSLSSLPEELIHHIFSYLPDDVDLVRTSAQSKWLRSSLCSFPALFLDLFREDATENDANALLKGACDAIESRGDDSCLQMFRLRVNRASEKPYKDGIDKLVHYALNNCTGSVALDYIDTGNLNPTSKNLHHPFSCPTSSVKLFKVLKLSGFAFDIHTLLLLFTCPLLEDIHIDSCKFPETVKACCPKLKRFILGSKNTEVSKIEVEAPSLKVFKSLTPSLHVAIHSSCTTITELSLSHVRSAHGLIENISKLSRLEKLIVLGCTAGHAKFSNPLLKMVEFNGASGNSTNTNSVKIDAPDLESLIIKNCSQCEVGPCPKLKTLEMVAVPINEELMKMRISEWRALEIVTLQSCSGIENLNIFSSSALKTLTLEDCHGLKNLNISSSTLQILTVQHCRGLTGFDVSSGSLRMVEISAKNEAAVMFKIRAPKLEALITETDRNDHYESRGGAYAIACRRSLRSLELKKQVMDARWRAHQIRNFPLLESLKLLPENGVIDVYFSSSSCNAITINGASANIQAFRLTSCRDIKTLQLDTASNVDHCLEDVLSKLVSLRDLTLTRCEDMKILKISHEQLRNLKLVNCDVLSVVSVLLPQLETFFLLDCKNMSKAFINTPRLSSFKYRGPVCITSLMHSMALHAELSLDHRRVGNMIYDKFNKLREFLQNFNRCERLTLDYFEDLIFPSKARNMAPPLSGLKHLELKELARFSFSQRTIEGLLWLCPAPQDFVFVTNDERKIIQFEYDASRFTGMKSYMEKVQESEAWRHYLKKITIEKFTSEEYNLLGNLFEKCCKLFTTINDHVVTRDNWQYASRRKSRR